jgi:hypothetical protein
LDDALSGAREEMLSIYQMPHRKSSENYSPFYETCGEQCDKPLMLIGSTTPSSEILLATYMHILFLATHN